MIISSLWEIMSPEIGDHNPIQPYGCTWVWGYSYSVHTSWLLNDNFVSMGNHEPWSPQVTTNSYSHTDVRECEDTSFLYIQVDFWMIISALWEILCPETGYTTPYSHKGGRGCEDTPFLYIKLDFRLTISALWEILCLETGHHNPIQPYRYTWVWGYFYSDIKVDFWMTISALGEILCPETGHHNPIQPYWCMWMWGYSYSVHTSLLLIDNFGSRGNLVSRDRSPHTQKLYQVKKSGPAWPEKTWLKPDLIFFCFSSIFTFLYQNYTLVNYFHFLV